jgi:N-acetylglucosamine-6-phosphate deacetylase
VSVITAVKDKRNFCREKAKNVTTLTNSENIPIDKNSGRLQIGKKALVTNMKSNLPTKKRPIEDSLVPLKPSKRIKTFAQKPEVDSPFNDPNM